MYETLTIGYTWPWWSLFSPLFSWLSMNYLISLGVTEAKTQEGDAACMSIFTILYALAVGLMLLLFKTKFAWEQKALRLHEFETWPEKTPELWKVLALITVFFVPYACIKNHFR